jgi:hypothetical protein
VQSPPLASPGSSSVLSPTSPAGGPVADASAAVGTAVAARVTVTPRNGQSLDQQARDQYECYQFAVAQSSFDPLRSNIPASAAVTAHQAEFARARAACYESRGYTVR